MTWDVSALFRHHSGMLMQGLRRRGFSAEAAADIVQDTFVRMLSIRAGSSDATVIPDNPQGYLQRIARNLSIDLARRDRSSPFAGVSLDEMHGVSDSRPSQERVLIDRQKLTAIAAALDTLPPQTRRAFELYRSGERTIAEVGREIGLSTSRTGALIKQAYTHLRHHLRDAGD